MDISRIAVLFCGQGRLDATGFAHCDPVRSIARDIFGQIDSVSARRLRIRISDLLADEALPQSQEYGLLPQEALQLGLFGASVAVYRYLVAGGFEPAVLVGHSFGQIAALVCAGALTVRDGASIVCERTLALGRAAGGVGSMAALRADTSLARVLIRESASGEVGIAVENSPEETLISGSAPAVDKVLAAARGRNVAYTRLLARHPLHCPALMRDVAAEFLTRIAGVVPRPLEVPVFSAHLGRYYHDADDLLACLARDIDTPLPFAGAVRALRAAGVRTFVECGVLSGFERHITACAPDSATLHAGMTTASLAELLRWLAVPNGSRGAAHWSRDDGYYPLPAVTLSASGACQPSGD